jgi:predicted NAD/FAD-dependent oxidoreductase
MQSLAEALSDGLDDVRCNWVSSLAKRGDYWTVREAPGEKWNSVVIAHNGKCADSLMTKSVGSSSAINELVKVTFGATLKNPRSMRKMQLCSLFVLVFAGPKDLLGTATARVVTGHPILSWVCSTSKKLGQGEGEGQECEHSYTIVSSREYGSANKVPQENIPPEKRSQVTADLLGAVEELYGMPKDSLVPSFSRLQLWGAAVPLNRLSAPCVYDSETKIGVCGDWFTPSATSTGPSIESAFLSGRLCADHISRGLSVGIEGHKFISSEGHHPLGDIGLTPSNDGTTGPSPTLPGKTTSPLISNTATVDAGKRWRKKEKV